MHSPNIRSGPISVEIREKDYILNHVDSVLNTKAFIQTTHALSATNKTIPTTAKNSITPSTTTATTIAADTVNVNRAKINSNRTTPTSSTSIATVAKIESSTAFNYTENKWDRMNNVDISYNRTFTEDYNQRQQRHRSARSHTASYSRHPYPQEINKSSSSSDDDEEECEKDRYSDTSFTAADYEQVQKYEEEYEEDEYEEEHDDISTQLPSNLVQFHFEFGSKRPPRTTVDEKDDASFTSDNEDGYQAEGSNFEYGARTPEIMDQASPLSYVLEDQDEEQIDIYNLSTDDEAEEEQKKWFFDTKYFPSATEEAIQTYETIKENIYIGSATGRSMAEESMPCQCKYKQSPCDNDNKCINRMMFMECMVQDCPCGRLCKNRRFQLGQYAPVDVIRTEKKGYGLRALTKLPSNSFILEYIGEVIPQKEFLRRTREYDAEGYKHYYFMTLKNDEIIDATKKGCLARFINHSCNPNCVTQKWVIGKKMRIGIFTNREISAGEELTFDYKFERYGATAQICYCGEPNCKGYIGASTAEVSIMDDSDSAAVALRIRRNREFQRRQYLLQQQQQRQQDYNHQHLNIFSSSSEEELEDDIRDEDEDDDDEEEDGDLDSDEEEDIDTQPLQDVKRVHFFVKRMLNSVGNPRLVNKLLNRLEITNVKNSLGREIFKAIIRLHGLKMFKFWLGEWKNDEAIVLKVLQVLDKLPLSNRNGLDDCKLLDVVQKFVDYNSSDVSVLAQLLLDKWNKLKVVYRIPKRSHITPTNHTSPSTATPSSAISHWIEGFEKNPEDDDETNFKGDSVDLKEIKETTVFLENSSTKGSAQKAETNDAKEVQDEEGESEIDIVDDDDGSELMDMSSSDIQPNEADDILIEEALITDSPVESAVKSPEPKAVSPLSTTSQASSPTETVPKASTPRMPTPQIPQPSIPKTSTPEPLVTVKEPSSEAVLVSQKQARKNSANHNRKDDSESHLHKAKRFRYSSSRELFDSDTDYYEYFPIHCAPDELRTISRFLPLTNIPNAPKSAVQQRPRYTTYRPATYTTTSSTAISNGTAAQSLGTNESATTDSYTLLLQQQAAKQQKQSLSLYVSESTSYYSNLYYPATTATTNTSADYSSYYHYSNYEPHLTQTMTKPAPSFSISHWQTAFNENGLPYYYNLITHQTQWEMPEELRNLQNLIPPPPPPPLPSTTPAATSTSSPDLKTEEILASEKPAATQAISSQRQPSPPPFQAQQPEQQSPISTTEATGETLECITRESAGLDDQHAEGIFSRNKHQLLTPTSEPVAVVVREESSRPHHGSHSSDYTIHKPLTTSFNSDGLNEIDLKMEVGKVVTKYLSSRQQVLWNGDKRLFKDLARKLTHFIVDREIQLGRKIRSIDVVYRDKIERFIDAYGSEYVANLQRNS